MLLLKTLALAATPEEGALMGGNRTSRGPAVAVGLWPHVVLSLGLDYDAANEVDQICREGSIVAVNDFV
jgi:hypothetical protein